MDSQTQIRPKRKGFLNFVLKNYFFPQDGLQQISVKNQTKKKYGIQELKIALYTQNKTNFRLYLTYKVPLLFFNAKINSNVLPLYFDELDQLLQMTEQSNYVGDGYFKNQFQAQKKKEERHYLAIIGKQLSKLTQFQQVQQNKHQQFGKKFYVKLINYIIQTNNNINNEKDAKSFLIEVINLEIENDKKKKEYVKEIIKKLVIIKKII